MQMPDFQVFDGQGRTPVPGSGAGACPSGREACGLGPNPYGGNAGGALKGAAAVTGWLLAWVGADGNPTGIGGCVAWG